MRAFYIIILALGLFSSSAISAELQQPRTVLELFTSQGCSSCPAADTLAAELSIDPDLLVLSLPVDYWDYLGWKDTLAKHEFTERQKAYSVTRGDKQIYTPQMVINGTKHVVGSERAEIIKSVTKINLVISLQIMQALDGHKLKIPALAGGSGTVLLLPILRSKTVSVGRGENHGRTLTYTNVVRSIVKLGEWKGEEASFDLPPIPQDTSTGKDLNGANAYAIIVQKGDLFKPNQILAAIKGSGF